MTSSREIASSASRSNASGAFFASWLVSLCAITGCKTSEGLFRAERARTQADAASVHVAVLSVARWEAYRDALQPRFELTEERALAEVVPTTQAFQQAVVDRMSGGLGAAQGFAGSPQSEDGGSKKKEKDSSGSEEHSSRHEHSLLEGALQVDPMLKYKAATALYQEVQLLNRYLQDAAISEGYTPYVVRVQLSLMPRRRDLPYDAYSTLSFFTTSPDSESLLEGDATRPSGTDLARRADAGVPLTRAKAGPRAWRTPRVLPLMVTDDLESSIQSRMLDNLRALSLSLAYLDQPFETRAELENMNREIESVYGRNLNSLLTVSRVSENSMYVRLGAVAQSSSRHAMVPQTHNITLLLMVPKEREEPIQLVTKTTLVDAESGAALEPKTQAELDRQLDGIARDYGAAALTRGVLMELMELVQRNDQAGFFARLEAALGTTALDDPRSLWVDLALVTNGSRYASSQFDLPPLGDVAQVVFPPTLTVLVTDGGAEGARVVLEHASGFEEMAAEDARLVIRKAGKVVSFGAEKHVFDASTHELQLVFPSPSQWGIAADPKVPLEFTLVLRRGRDRRIYDAAYRIGP